MNSNKSHIHNIKSLILSLTFPLRTPTLHQYTWPTRTCSTNSWGRPSQSWPHWPCTTPLKSSDRCSLSLKFPMRCPFSRLFISSALSGKKIVTLLFEDLLLEFLYLGDRFLLRGWELESDLLAVKLHCKVLAVDCVLLCCEVWFVLV